MRPSRQYDRLFIVTIIGDGQAGKSCLLQRFNDNTFHDPTDTTIGVDFRSKIVMTQSGRTILMQMWDTSGQQRFHSITTSYYRGSMGFLVVYDTTDRASFDNLTQWLQEIKQRARENCPVVLVGTKADLKAQRAVPVEEARAFAERHCGGANSLVETSAKTNEGVDHAFQLLTEQINRQQEEYDEHTRGSSSLPPPPSGALPHAAGSTALAACCNLQ